MLAEVRPGGDQDPVGRPRGDPLEVAQLTRATFAVVVRAGAQQEIGHPDLKQPEAQEIVRKLVKGADVVIEELPSRRDGEVGARLERSVEGQPGLVMVRLSGFGQTGPYRTAAGALRIGESMGGLRYVTGHPTDAPVRVGVSSAIPLPHCTA